MSFDPYRKWLGIPSNRRPPTFYELLGIEPGENDSDVIRAALQQRRAFVQSKRGEGYDTEVRKILGEFEEAASTLLVPEFKHGYDRQFGFGLKTKPKGNRRSYILPSWMESRVVHVYGGGSGIVGDLFGIVAILFGAFALMAWFSVVIHKQKPDEDLDEVSMAQATSSFIEPVAEMGLDKSSLPVEKMLEPVQPPQELIASVEPVRVPKVAETKPTAITKPKVPEPDKTNNRTTADGWQSLFDGQSLDGWKSFEKQLVWRVKDGCMVSSGGANGQGDTLIYEGDPKVFKNFHITSEIKTTQGSHAGILFHVRGDLTKPETNGFLVGINTSNEAANKTGSLWNVKHIHQSPVKDDEWFLQEIIVKGKQVVVKVNGKVMVDYDESAPKKKNTPQTNKRLGEGTFVLQGRSPGRKTYFRNIKVKRLD